MDTLESLIPYITNLMNSKEVPMDTKLETELLDLLDSFYEKASPELRETVEEVRGARFRVNESF